MKTKIYIFAFALLCTIFTAQSNNYIWLHGLNDNYSCWYIYQNEFTPSGKRLSYDSESGIKKMSSDLWDSNYRLNSKTDNILIGHSMGGLIARELEFNHSGSIKGIITVGTPHHGACVLGELTNGGANNLTRKVAGKAKGSVQASVTAICFTIPGVGFVLPASINLGIDGLFKYVGLPYIDKSLNEEVAKNYGAQCSKDMIPESDYMNEISNRKVNVPILTFACQEDRWQLARLGYCTQNLETLQKNDNINVDGNFDMGGYNQLKSLNGSFKTVGGVHAGIAAGCAIGGFFFPYLWAASGAHGYASSRWYSTAGYIDDGLDFDHAVLLGSYHVDKVVEKHRFLWNKWTTTRYVKVPEPHDGVVGINSQQLDKSKGTNVIWANTTIKGVNHLEEFNHPNTRAEMNKALKGGYNPVYTNN